MTKTKVNGDLVSLQAADGKKLYDMAHDAYHGQITVPSERVADFKEVPASEVPTFTKDDYDRKVAELIRRKYSQDEEFAIQRKYLGFLNGEGKEADREEFLAYNDYAEECKVRAKDPALYALPLEEGENA